jgi:hypothetical protein
MFDHIRKLCHILNENRVASKLHPSTCMLHPCILRFYHVIGRVYESTTSYLVNSFSFPSQPGGRFEFEFEWTGTPADF